MFEEPGKKIKVVAVIIFILGVIGSFVLAFEFGVEIIRSSFNFYVKPFFAYLIGGIVSSYVTSLLLYGLGEAIEDMSVLCERLHLVNQKLERFEKNGAPKEKNNAEGETHDYPPVDTYRRNRFH